MKRTATILGIVTALAVPSVAAAGNNHPAQAGKPLVAHKIQVAHKVQIAKLHRAVAARVTIQRATNLRGENAPFATGQVWIAGMDESTPVFYINRGNVAY
jgi:hypothetical protein